MEASKKGDAGRGPISPSTSVLVLANKTKPEPGLNLRARIPTGT